MAEEAERGAAGENAHPPDALHAEPDALHAEPDAPHAEPDALHAGPDAPHAELGFSVAGVLSRLSLLSLLARGVLWALAVGAGLSLFRGLLTPRRASPFILSAPVCLLLALATGLVTGLLVRRLIRRSRHRNVSILFTLGFYLGAFAFGFSYYLDYRTIRREYELDWAAQPRIVAGAALTARAGPRRYDPLTETGGVEEYIDDIFIKAGGAPDFYGYIGWLSQSYADRPGTLLWLFPGFFREKARLAWLLIFAASLTTAAVASGRMTRRPIVRPVCRACGRPRALVTIPAGRGRMSELARIIPALADTFAPGADALAERTLRLEVCPGCRDPALLTVLDPLRLLRGRTLARNLELSGEELEALLEIARGSDAEEGSVLAWRAPEAEIYGEMQRALLLAGALCLAAAVLLPLAEFLGLLTSPFRAGFTIHATIIGLGLVSAGIAWAWLWRSIRRRVWWRKRRTPVPPR